MELYEAVKSKITRGDQGVSPVIAVILMVAITVVLAATVYVWVSGFASDTSGPTNANVRASGYEAGGGGSTDFVRLTLTAGDGAPYAMSVIGLEIVNHTGGVHDQDAGGTEGQLCSGPSAESSNKSSGDPPTCTAGATSDWSVGSSLFVPCHGDGTHQLTVTISGSTVLDSSVSCDAPAAPYTTT